MKLRVAEICKNKGLTLKDLATKLGITNVGLSQQLNGNPTIGTLEKIADALDVHICDLFNSPEPVRSINGFIEFKKTVYKIETIESLEKLLKKIKDS
ncbi:MAG: helix-turn-helix transcriptional regulator [Tannerellaceae bacterium]|nr:helix-turn-helix transcriptional regulator [Tannerellaceae bacterium]MCD8178708.1 helix-turn-helix transcriptional regulator [Tannerellaceae bacterium]